MKRVVFQYGPYTMTWKHDNLTYTAGVNWQLNENHSLGVRADFTQQTNGANQVIYGQNEYVKFNVNRVVFDYTMRLRVKMNS